MTTRQRGSKLVASAALVPKVVAIFDAMASALFRRQLSDVAGRSAPGLVYPGSGMFFWWQAGATAALASKIDLRRAQFAGASGGALASTLAACEVDSFAAFDVAHRLAADAGVLGGGPWALRGVWGAIIRDWLQELLPPDAAERCRGRVSLLVRRPFFAPELVSDFSSRADLIDACLASAHVPLFMDGKLTASFRGRAHIDSDVLSLSRGSPLLALPGPSVRVSCGRDPRIRKQASSVGGSFKLVSREGILDMMEWGQRHVHVLEATGKLEALEELRLPASNRTPPLRPPSA